MMPCSDVATPKPWDETSSKEVLSIFGTHGRSGTEASKLEFGHSVGIVLVVWPND